MTGGAEADHPTVHIHYLRPPDREEVFVQKLLLDSDEVKVTFARNVEFDEPIVIDGRVALESGSDAVWFTFPGAWHDIGRFHRADGSFTGIYANVLTPCDFGDDGLTWHTTDLFLDVWVPAGRRPEADPDGVHILDRDQLQEAVSRGWVEDTTAQRAAQEAERLVKLASEGRWPPDVVSAWTRERALEAVASTPRRRP